MLKVLLIAISLFSFNCSLMGLSDLELFECKKPADGTTDPCEPLNKGREKACMRYQCSPDGKGCVLSVTDRDYDGAIDPSCKKVASGSPKLDCDDINPDRYPGNKEICDGIDNDCDLIIDENSIVDLQASPPKRVVDATAARESIVFNPGAAGEVVASYASLESLDINFTLISGTLPAINRSLQYDKKCRLERTIDQNGIPMIQAKKCDLDEVAAAKIEEDMWFTAAINVDGCDDGQLRVGYVLDDSSPEFTQIPKSIADDTKKGPETYLSNTRYGIDVESSLDRRQCSGASHPDLVGAARLSLASLMPEQQEPQALLAWIGDSIERDECGKAGQSVPVHALGLWLYTDPSANKWVVASDEAEPAILGRTVGGGRPAIAVWPGAPADRGYFVGYGDQNGQVALHFVPRLGLLPAAWQSDGVAKLGFGPAYRFADNRAGADHVAIAPVNNTDNIVRNVCGPGQTGLEIGVAWQEKCGQAQGGVFFTVVGFVTSTEAFCLQHDIIEIANGSATEGQLVPTVAYLGSGFMEPGFTRNDKTATDDTTGGWVVAWAGKTSSGESAVFARRISELDGQLVDTEEQMVLSEPKGMSSNPILYPSNLGGKGLFYAYYHSEPNGFMAGSLLSCEPDK
jgi:hypothetical protein